MISLRQKTVQLILIILILYGLYLLRKNLSGPPEFSVCRDVVHRKYVEEPVEDYAPDLNKPNQRYALLWTPFHGDPYWGLQRDTVDHRYFSRLECPETNCVITTDRTLRPIDKYNAIVYSGSEDWQEKPDKRHEDQLYIFATLDPPTKMMRNLSLDADFFNLTMTYRMDSDLYFGGGRFQHAIKEYIMPPSKENKWHKFDNKFTDEHLLSVAKKKTKDVLWLSAGCWTQSNAEEIIDALQDYIDVDVLSPCDKDGCRVSKRLSQRINSTYRYWAVFENSLCDDYLSEKVYFAMEHNVIPIVYSGVTEYAHFMPPNSYIDANKFASVEELGKYLKKLSQDPNEYIKYFHYKLNYRSLWTFDFCNLCIKLLEPNLEEKVSIYNDIENWWMKGFCVRPKLKLK